MPQTVLSSNDIKVDRECQGLDIGTAIEICSSQLMKTLKGYFPWSKCQQCITIKGQCKIALTYDCSATNQSISACVYLSVKMW